MCGPSCGESSFLTTFRPPSMVCISIIITHTWIIINYSLPYRHLNTGPPQTEYMKQMTYQYATMPLCHLYFKVFLWNNTSTFLCNDIVKQLHFKNVRTHFADGISVFFCFCFGPDKTKNDCLNPPPHRYDVLVVKILNSLWFDT